MDRALKYLYEDSMSMRRCSHWFLSSPTVTTNMLADGLLGVSLGRRPFGCADRGPQSAEDCRPDSVSSLKATGAPRRSAQSSARTGIQYLCTVPGTSRVFFTNLQDGYSQHGNWAIWAFVWPFRIFYNNTLPRVLV